VETIKERHIVPHSKFQKLYLASAFAARGSPQLSLLYQPAQAGDFRRSQRSVYGEKSDLSPSLWTNLIPKPVLLSFTKADGRKGLKPLVKRIFRVISVRTVNKKPLPEQLMNGLR